MGLSVDVRLFILYQTRQNRQRVLSNLVSILAYDIERQVGGVYDLFPMVT